MPPIDPKLVKKIIEAVAKIVEEIKEKHLISKIVLASAVVVPASSYISPLITSFFRRYILNILL